MELVDCRDQALSEARHEHSVRVRGEELRNLRSKVGRQEGERLARRDGPSCLFERGREALQRLQAVHGVDVEHGGAVYLGRRAHVAGHDPGRRGYRRPAAEHPRIPLDGALRHHHRRDRGHFLLCDLLLCHLAGVVADEQHSGHVLRQQEIEGVEGFAGLELPVLRQNPHAEGKIPRGVDVGFRDLEPSQRGFAVGGYDAGERKDRADLHFHDALAPSLPPGVSVGGSVPSGAEQVKAV